LSKCDLKEKKKRNKSLTPNQEKVLSDYEGRPLCGNAASGRRKRGEGGPLKIGEKERAGSYKIMPYRLKEKRGGGGGVLYLGHGTYAEKEEGLLLFVDVQERGHLHIH